MFRFEDAERNEMLRRFRTVLVQHSLDTKHEMNTTDAADFLVRIIENAIQVRTRQPTLLVHVSGPLTATETLETMKRITANIFDDEDAEREDGGYLPAQRHVSEYDTD